MQNRKWIDGFFIHTIEGNDLKHILDIKLLLTLIVKWDVFTSISISA